MKSDRIDCDWRIGPRKPGWQTRAGGREHILWRPGQPTFRVYASGNGWRISAHGVALLPEHRGMVWETAREAAVAVKEYAQTERGEPKPAPVASLKRCMVATPPAVPIYPFDTTSASASMAAERSP